MEAFDTVAEFIGWIDAEVARIDGPDGPAMHNSVWERSYQQASMNAIRFRVPCQPDSFVVLRSYSWPTNSEEAKMIRDDLRSHLTSIKSILTGESAIPAVGGGVVPRLAERLRAAIEPSLLDMHHGQHASEAPARALCEYIAEQLGIDADARRGIEFYRMVARSIINRLAGKLPLDQIDAAEIADLEAMLVPEGFSIAMPARPVIEAPSQPLDVPPASTEAENAPAAQPVVIKSLPTRSMDELRKAAGNVSKNTIRRWADGAKVPRPGVGEHSRPYSFTQAMAILEAGEQSTTQKAIREALRKSLDEMQAMAVSAGIMIDSKSTLKVP